EKGSWNEFTEKTKIEWKMSFAIWYAIFSVIVGTIAGKFAQSDLNVNCYVLFTLCGVLLIIHFLYLFWIQKCLRKSRDFLYEIRERMRDMVELSNIEQEALKLTNKTAKQFSIWLQLAVTALLLGNLICIVI
ncbi:MAG: hypothetical protein K8S56_08245, partial [Candidatus Cloacimonetes bacterium]|nr:hypothetical protein [Candidatus Cloacimonadota bacterium]